MKLLHKVGLWFGCTVFLTLGLAAVVALWLTAWGMPHALYGRWLGPLRDQGLEVELERLAWRPPDGLRVDGLAVTLRGDPDVGFQADRLDVVLGRGAAQNGVEFRHLRMVNGRLRLGGGADRLSAEGIAGTVEAGPGGRYVVDLQARVPGLARVRCGGALLLVKGGGEARDGSLGDRFLASRDLLLERAGPVLAALGGAASWDEPLVCVRFNLDAVRPERDTVQVAVEGGAMAARGLVLDGWCGRAQWARGQAAMSEVTLRSGPSLVSATGTLEPGSGRYEVRLLGNVEPLLFLPWLPTNAATVVAGAGVSGPLVVDVAASGHVGAWRAGEVRANAHSASAGTEDAGVTLLRLVAAYSNGVFRADDLSVRIRRPMEAIPPAWRDLLRAQRVEACEEVRLKWWWTGTSVAQLLAHGGGELTMPAVTWRGTALRDVAVPFRFEGDRMRADPVRASVGAAGTAGRVTGWGEYSRVTGAYEGRAEVTALADALLPLLPEGVARVTEGMTFGEPLGVSLGMSGCVTNPLSRRIAVRVLTGDFTRNGVCAEHMDLDLVVATNRLVAERVLVVGTNGVLRGRFAQDFADRRMRLDMSVKGDPVPLARLVGFGLPRLLAPYRLEGGLHARIAGELPYGQDAAGRDLTVRVDGEKLGLGMLVADRASFDLRVRDDAIALTGLEGDWCGGTLSGTVTMQRVSGATNWLGQVDMRVAGVDLGRVVESIGGGTNTQEGRLSGRIELSGPMGGGFLAGARGSGHVAIDDGYLLTMPLFGGLSKYISRLIPGFGYASQRDFLASFRVEDGALTTEDARLLGRLISVAGRGTYAFDGALDFRLQVKFLKDGLTATVTRLVTSPLTKALEFALTGTVAAPHWAPVNTPDRLLKFFGDLLLPSTGDAKGRE